MVLFGFLYVSCFLILLAYLDAACCSTTMTAITVFVVYFGILLPGEGWHRVSPYSTDWPRAHCVVQTGFGLVKFLPGSQALGMLMWANMPWLKAIWGIISNYLINYWYCIGVCAHVYVYTPQVYRHCQRLEEDIGSPGAGVIDHYEPW